MACVEPGGTLSPSGTAMLRSMDRALTAEEISQISGQPLFKVRASMRELTEAGFVSRQGDTFVITDAGKEAIRE